jgi:hypothetical protein
MAITYPVNAMKPLKHRRDLELEKAVEYYLAPLNVKEIRVAINPLKFEHEIGILWMENDGTAKCCNFMIPHDLDQSIEKVHHYARDCAEVILREYEDIILKDDEDEVDRWCAEDYRRNGPWTSKPLQAHDEQVLIERNRAQLVADMNTNYPWRVWKV